MVSDTNPVTLEIVAVLTTSLGALESHVNVKMTSSPRMIFACLATMNL